MDMRTSLVVTAFVLIAVLAFNMPGCQTGGVTATAAGRRVPSPVVSSGLASGLYWCPSSAPNGRWAVLLPGASGLKVFDDEGHYFLVADALNARGFDVLVIDYKRAYKEAPSRPRVPTGKKIAWVVEQSLAWARQDGRIPVDQPGAIIAWSLGAEGLWPLLSDGEKASSLGITAVAAYYPSNEDREPIANSVPLLILVGERDDVTPASEVRGLVNAANSGAIELHVYPDANHGFDIASIQPPKTVRLLPLVGPSGTFGYDKAAAADAWVRLDAFLDQHVPTSISTTTNGR